MANEKIMNCCKNHSYPNPPIAFQKVLRVINSCQNKIHISTITEWALNQADKLANIYRLALVDAICFKRKEFLYSDDFSYSYSKGNH